MLHARSPQPFRRLEEPLLSTSSEGPQQHSWLIRACEWGQTALEPGLTR